MKQILSLAMGGLLVAAQLAAAEPSASRKLVGMAEILSGDTLAVAGTTVHLTGIEAPEQGQHCRVASGRTYDCGLVSKTALMDLTVATRIGCTLTGGVRNNLPLARCFAAGYDLSRGMVHTGWALAWPKSGTVYSAIEKAAKRSSNGLWRGSFITPWDWRDGQRLGPEHSSSKTGRRSP